MSHHSYDEKSSPIHELLRKDLGATGEHPDGKLNKHDEGGIAFAVGVHEGKVVMDFGKPTAWIGMNPQDAMDLASILINNARVAARQSGQPISMSL
jgi:hypothetical protein